ncbi:MAG: amino acid ABC transporter ATP-binding protein [Clostridia bacterium]|nr:amino acid ABC transporter ATP-binding protein [Clostridia bacterium]
MEILRIENLKKTFGEATVLSDISLSVNSGEVVSVIGSSGSGKSTLLRCATMLEKVSGGSILYAGDVMCREENGKEIYSDKKTLAKIRSRFGLVFQNFNLFPHMTVLQNVTEAPIKVMKRNRAEVEAEAMELLEKMGLEYKMSEYPCRLSGGQQQRVSIARALISKPDILFFDEPTSALDPELTAGVLKIIKELAADNMTMVVVTHEMNFARDISNRIIFLDNGKIEAQGTPDDLFSNTSNGRLREFLSSFYG